MTTAPKRARMRRRPEDRDGPVRDDAAGAVVDERDLAVIVREHQRPAAPLGDAAEHELRAAIRDEGTVAVHADGFFLRYAGGFVVSSTSSTHASGNGATPFRASATSTPSMKRTGATASTINARASSASATSLV